MSPSESGNLPQPPRRAALKIALIYGAFAGVWIFGSDWLLASLLPQATINKLTHLQNVKGMAFVTVTAVMLWTLIRSALLKLERSQDAAVLSEKGLARAQAIAKLGSWNWDLVSGTVVWSAQMFDLLELPRDSAPLTLERFQQLLHPDDAALVPNSIDGVLATPLPFNYDYRIITASGRLKHINAQGDVDRDAVGKPTRFHGTLLDITPRKQAEEELRKLNETLEGHVADRTARLHEAMEDLHTFSYMVAHDLRTPLRMISRFAAELHESDACKAAPPEAAESARRIAAAATRLERLVHDLFEYSRLARAEITPQQISTVLVAHEVVGQLMREPEFARAQIDIREPMPWVLAHRPTLAMVLQNLLQNAAKFTAAGTTPLITVSSETRGDMSRITVEDNGVGMEPQRAAMIFGLFEQPHQSSDTGGSGIGLAIVRRGVERMGGKVGVDSAPNQGSRFWIELPTDPQSP